MLARLDAVPGVAESRVEASGRFFLLALAPGADPAAVVAAARGALRGRGRALDAAAAAAQLDARERGDPWLSAREVHALSYVEGRIVAFRAADAVAASAGLDGAARAALAEAARAELFLAIERVHAEGGRESSGWFYEEWPRLAAAIAARLRDAVPAPLHGRVAEALLALHAR